WRLLRRALDDPTWATDVKLETAAGRRDAHDDIDEHITAWTTPREPAAVAALLSTAGVPAEVVINARDVVFNQQVRHRRLFEVEHHPVTGDHELPGLPFR